MVSTSATVGSFPFYSPDSDASASANAKSFGLHMRTLSVTDWVSEHINELDFIYAMHFFYISKMEGKKTATQRASKVMTSIRENDSG